MKGAVARGALFALCLTATPIQAGSQAPTPAARPAAPKVDPKADRLLRAMGATLAGLRSFRFTADHATDVVTDAGQKLEFVASSRVAVQRPDRLRSDRVGELADASLYYDGQAITIYGRRAELYATAPAPKTIDQVLDYAREELDLETPAADLLYSDAYRVLMEDVVEGDYVGTARIDGQTCHHLAYRGVETDWQIWIRDGARALPCKYLIVSKKQPSAPEFSVVLRGWELSPTLTAEVFQPRVSPEAARIDFLPADQPQTRRR